MCTGCFEGLARGFLYLTNLLAFLGSCAVLGLSIWIYVARPSFVEVFGNVGVNLNLYNTGCIILMTFSCLVILITFFGCCGAAKDSKCMLWTYFALVLLLLVGVAVGAYFVLSGNTDELQKPFLESLKEYDPEENTSPARALVTMWDGFQQDYKCCGVDSYLDWQNYNPYFDPSKHDSTTRRYSWSRRPDFNGRTSKHDSQSLVPESCCDPALDQEFCSKTLTTSSGIFATGCFDKVVEEINKHGSTIGTVAIVMLVVMIVNSIIAIYMSSCGYHSSRPRYRYGRTATQDY